MKKIILLMAILCILLAAMVPARAQVAINADGSVPHTSAMLDIKSGTKGLLIPRMTTAQRTTLGAVATGGLMVYDTDLNRYYFHNGTGWEISAFGDFWSANGTSAIFATDITDLVGIGTTNPARKLEVSGGWQTARLTTTSSGPSLEFMGSSATDWGIAQWINSLRLLSTTDGFSTSTDQFYFSETEFRPWTDGSKSLGTNAGRWSSVYGMDGLFSVKVGIGTTNPVTNLEVLGPLRTARLTSNTAGALLEFASTEATDWAVGTWTNSTRLMSTTDDFVTLQDEYSFAQTEFVPWTTNTKTIGSSTRRWSTVYGVNAGFTGDAVIGGTMYLGKLHVHDGVNRLAKLYITPAAIGSGDSSMIFLGEDYQGYYGMYWLYEGSGNNMQLYGKAGITTYGPHMQIERTNGYVAIGSTFATGYRLSVEGKIICTELRVNLVADWPDYVFKQDYQLMPLDRLGAFIQKNGHLPNVPPASEIERSGLEVGEMQRLMMEKIEELSLYILKQQEQIDALQDQIEKDRK
jgi:hypothetical protein